MPFRCVNIEKNYKEGSEEMKISRIVVGPNRDGKFVIVKTECNGNKFFPMCTIALEKGIFDTREEALAEIKRREKRRQKTLRNLKWLQKKQKKEGERI